MRLCFTDLRSELCPMSDKNNLQDKCNYKPFPKFHGIFIDDKLKSQTEFQKPCKTYACKVSVPRLFRSNTSSINCKQHLMMSSDKLLCPRARKEKFPVFPRAFPLSQNPLIVSHLLQTTRFPTSQVSLNYKSKFSVFKSLLIPQVFVALLVLYRTKKSCVRVHS